MGWLKFSELWKLEQLQSTNYWLQASEFYGVLWYLKLRLLGVKRKIMASSSVRSDSWIESSRGLCRRNWLNPNKNLSKGYVWSSLFILVCKFWIILWDYCELSMYLLEYFKYYVYTFLYNHPIKVLILGILTASIFFYTLFRLIKTNVTHQIFLSH